jgi:serine/threonine protein kinase/Flp pilus assembly protein TadD
MGGVSNANATSRAAGPDAEQDASTPTSFDVTAAAFGEVESLRHPLPQHATDSSMFAAAPGSFAASDEALDRFPGYQLIREIRRGGQGVVYQAVRETTGEDVAIKVLHDRAAARPRELERFEREARLLREIDHPNIIGFQEIGVAAGRPYLVMPYIGGWPLDEYVRRNALPIRETLALFAQVCDAVHAAHLHGVIHRDLKPGNVRVDDAGQPHVLDFGLAKASEVRWTPPTSPAAGTGIPSGSSTVGTGIPSSSPLGRALAAETGILSGSLTETGQFLGSLPWASPEQAEGRRGIDLRTDVYSLGAMLFYLLTDAYPIDPSGSTREVLNRIVQTEPARPRAVLIASDPRVGRHAGDIDNDVETITLKCLSKDPARRYQSAGDLAADLRRYLAGEAIEAKRDSALYVLRKTLRRHRVPVAVAAAFSLLLVSATTLSIALWRQAAANAVESARQADETELAATMLTDMIGTADPHETHIPSEAMRHRLDSFTASFGPRLVGHPDVEARVRLALGSAYRVIAEPARAEPHLARALALSRELFGPQHPRLATAMYEWALLLCDKLDVVSAEAMNREALAMRRRLFGDVHLDVAYSLDLLGDILWRRGEWAGSEAALRESLAIVEQLHGAQHREATGTLTLLARTLLSMGRLDEAEAVQRRSISLHRKTYGEEHPQVANSLDLLGRVLRAKGDRAAAQVLFEDALAMERRVLGDEHTAIAATQIELGMLLESTGQFGRAEQLLREALMMRRKLLGDEHLDVASALNGLGLFLKHRGDFVAAESLLREALAINRRLLGDEHLNTATALNNLAALLDDAGKRDAAEPPYREALDIMRKLLGEGHRAVAITRHNLATLLYRNDDFAAAEPLVRESLATMRRVSGAEHPDVLPPVELLASLLVLSDEYAEAEPLLRDAIRILEKAPETNPGLYGSSVSWLAEVLQKTGRGTEATDLYRDAADRLRANLPAAENALHRLLMGFGLLLDEQAEYIDAIQFSLQAHSADW